MSGEFELNDAIFAANRAAGAAGDASGNCDECVHLIEIGNAGGAAQRIAWAEDNARIALSRIIEARAAIAKAFSST